MIRSTTRSLAAVIAAVALLTAAGCARHKDFPTPLSLVTPPTPGSVDIVDEGSGNYTISWTVPNPAVVDHYNLYSVTAFGTSLEATTTATDIGVSIGVQLAGVVFGISAVTVENVEGAMATVVTPEPAPAR